MTIRQDLKQLEQQGFIKRVHGGAILNDTDDISTRMVFHYRQKIRIARKAASLVNEGETVTISFDADFDAVISALYSRDLRIGMQVQGIEGDDGDSDSFIIVSEPAAMLLLGVGLIGLGALGRKKFIKK